MKPRISCKTGKKTDISSSYHYKYKNRHQLIEELIKSGKFEFRLINHARKGKKTKRNTPKTLKNNEVTEETKNGSSPLSGLELRGRECRNPRVSGNGTDLAKKPRHLRSKEARIRRKVTRNANRASKRSQYRSMRKWVEELAAPDTTYPTAQEQGLSGSKNTPQSSGNKHERTFADIINHQKRTFEQRDNGGGISKFLWKEEIDERNKALKRMPSKDRNPPVQPPNKTKKEGVQMPKDNRDQAPPKPPDPEVQVREVKICKKKLKVAFWNTKGAAHLGAREKIVHFMKTQKIHILFLAETHVNTNSTEEHDGYTFIFSTKITDAQRAEADKKRQAKAKKRAKRKKRKGQPEGEAKGESNIELHNLDAEKLGVAVVYENAMDHHIKDCEQIDDRNITLVLKGIIGEVSFTGTHAHHAEAKEEQKIMYYDQLGEIHTKRTKNANAHYFIGDFNTRLIQRTEEEKYWIGPHFLREDLVTLERLSDGQLENREMFMQFCADYNYIPINTWFEKTPDKLVTYRSPNKPDFRPPYTLDNYAQMDFLLAQDKWKNSCRDAETKLGAAFDSDHKALLTIIQQKLASQKKEEQEHIKRYRKPNEEEMLQYNKEISQRISEIQTNCEEPFKELANIMKLSADIALTEIPKEQKKPYITSTTWSMLQDKQRAIDENRLEDAKTISKLIQKQIRIDKKQQKLDMLEEMDDQGYKWTGLKRMKSKFTPKFCKFKDSNGNRIPAKEYAHKAADYLEKVQWKDAENLPNIDNEKPDFTECRGKIKDEPFHRLELDEVIKKLTNGKTPGPDFVTTELVKWLNESNRAFLLTLINRIIEKDELEESLKLANVASIYKKGNSSDLANYRPISLLQTFYKILASLIKERIDSGLDEWLTKTQYGFRQGRSTAQAIYLARRILDMSEMEGSNITMILLDWEKAFDKIDHERMMQALKRAQVPDNMLKLIKMIYKDPKFRVRSNKTDSTYRDQKTGIRQGCPLSPYLFVVVMAVLMKDVKNRLNTPKQKEPINGIKFAEILYADDTLLFGTHTQNINKFLKEIQIESEYYNMRLNLNKCINLTGNQRMSSVKFKDGTKVPREHQATYLGTTLTDNNNNKAEISNRIADCCATANRLKLFWNKAKTTKKWKLQVYDAIIRSKLLYGLECVQLTPAEQARIDAFQMKGIRRLMNIPPTHIDRTYTNEIVWELASIEAGKPLWRFTDMWLKQKLKLLGHVIRSGENDPMYQVTFEPGTRLPKMARFLRAGRPRAQWITQTMSEALDEILQHTGIVFDFDNQEHLDIIWEEAINRQGIFATKPQTERRRIFSMKNELIDKLLEDKVFDGKEGKVNDDLLEELGIELNLEDLPMEVQEEQVKDILDELEMNSGKTSPSMPELIPVTPEDLLLNYPLRSKFSWKRGNFFF